MVLLLLCRLPFYSIVALVAVCLATNHDEKIVG
jgi:hypothetical protein